MHIVVTVRAPEEASSGDYTPSDAEGTETTELLTHPAQDSEQADPDYGTTLELRGATEYLFTGDLFADAVAAGGLAPKIQELNEKPVRVAVRKFTLDDTTLLCTVLGPWDRIQDRLMDELRADLEEVFGVNITVQY